MKENYSDWNKNWHGPSHKGLCKDCTHAWKKGNSRWCIKRNGTLPKSKKVKQCEYFKSKGSA